MFQIERQLKEINSLDGIEEAYQDNDVMEYELKRKKYSLYVLVNKKNRSSIISLFKNKPGFLSTEDVIAQIENVYLKDFIKDYQGYLK